MGTRNWTKLESSHGEHNTGGNQPYGSGYFLDGRLSVEAVSAVPFLVDSRCSRRFGRAAPLVVALLLVVDVGVWLGPGRLFLALEGEEEGAVGLTPFTFVWTTGAGGFFILVAVAGGFAITAAMMGGFYCL